MSKVAIIGGGTIGLYLALKLVEKENQVSVFERKEEIGTRVCSGLFSQKILDFIPQASNIIENEITHAFLHFPKKTIKLSFKEKFFTMSHFNLDNLLYSSLKNNVVLGSNITSIPDGYNRIIGCDGAFSFVRACLNLKNPSFYLGLKGTINEKDDSSCVETWPTKNGFIWKIPRGKEIEYGIMEKPREAKKMLDIFLKKNKINIKKIEARIIPRGISIPNTKTITLCGDATGITKPWSGGGVIWGLKSADMLASSFPDFNLYHKKMKRFFFPKVAFYNTLAKSVYFTGFNIPWIIPRTVKIEPDFLI